jgi:7,8-dihydro-6-hydroxymethylpterin-pyrophosphokinase
MKAIYLSLGSNVGDRKENLRAAIAALADAGVRVTRRVPHSTVFRVRFLSRA